MPSSRPTGTLGVSGWFSGTVRSVVIKLHAHSEHVVLTGKTMTIDRVVTTHFLSAWQYDQLVRVNSDG